MIVTIYNQQLTQMDCGQSVAFPGGILGGGGVPGGEEGLMPWEEGRPQEGEEANTRVVGEGEVRGSTRARDGVESS